MSVIISNAIDNAIKYTNKGFVKVSYTVNDDGLLVVVHDSGIGISAADIVWLTKMPNQLHNHIRRKRDGWGIGMATMLKLSDFLGGSVSIDSKVNFGTRVEIRLPVKTASALPTFNQPPQNEIYPDWTTETQERPLPAYLKTTDPLPKLDSNAHIRILVIDNDDQHLQQMQALLSPQLIRRNDIEVYTSLNVANAIQLIEETFFDILLIDYHMPELDGLQFLQFIDENETECRDSLKVVLTADASIPRIVEQKMYKLAYRVMSKGITLEQILSLIRTISLKSVKI